MIIIGEDWNASVDYDVAMINWTIGKYGIGVQCINGERLRFVEEHEFFVINTFFQHRRKHIVTWKSPDNQHSNQIYYLVIHHWKSIR